MHASAYAHVPAHLYTCMLAHTRLCNAKQVKSARVKHVQVIAMACLHLAAKMEESPKSIKELVKESIRTRFSYLGEQEVNQRLQKQVCAREHGGMQQFAQQCTCTWISLYLQVLACSDLQ